MQCTWGWIAFFFFPGTGFFVHFPLQKCPEVIALSHKCLFLCDTCCHCGTQEIQFQSVFWKRRRALAAICSSWPYSLKQEHCWMLQRQDKIIYVLKGNWISETFLSKVSFLFSSLGLPCLAPAPLLQTWKWSQSPACCTLKLYCVLWDSRTSEENQLFESQSSLWPSGTATFLCAELSLASHAVGSHSSPLLSEDQRSHLTYQ